MNTSNILIRDEKDTDDTGISEVTQAAFETMDISNYTEQHIIDALRSAHALTISLVAETEGQVVGYIAFSPVTVSVGANGWYGLGPVSVHPDFQRKGIGKALIGEGLLRPQRLHAKGCCLVGHPLYYRQFGFENTEALSLEGVPSEVFVTLPFDGHMPNGIFGFHDAFKAGGKV